MRGLAATFLYRKVYRDIEDLILSFDQLHNEKPSPFHEATRHQHEGFPRKAEVDLPD